MYAANLFSEKRIQKQQAQLDEVNKLNQLIGSLSLISDNNNNANVEPNNDKNASTEQSDGSKELVQQLKRVALNPPQSPAKKPFQRLTKRPDIKALLAFADFKADREKAKRCPPSMTDYLHASIYRKITPAGIALLKKTERTLFSMFPKGLYLFQKKLIDEAFRVSLRQLLDDQFENLNELVCKQRRWESCPRNLFTVASRRSGKTVALAAFCAAMLVCVPKMTIIVYSVALRTAQEFVRLVQRYVQLTPEGRAMLQNPGGSERLVLQGPDPGDERWIRSFPSGGKAQNVSFICSLFLFRLGGPFSLFQSHRQIIYSRFSSLQKLLQASSRDGWRRRGCNGHGSTANSADSSRASTRNTQNGRRGSSTAQSK